MTEQFQTPYRMPLPSPPSGGGGLNRGTDLMERNHPVVAGIVQFDIFRNNSGATVPRGSVVVIDQTSALSFTTSATLDNAEVLGVTLEQITNGAPGRVAISGRVMVRVAAGTTAGQYLRQSTTAGVAIGTDDPTQGTFGFARMDRNATTGWSEATLSIHTLASQAFATTWTVKTADESLNSSTTYQDDDELVNIALAASSTYSVEILIRYFTASSTPDIKVRIATPQATTAVRLIGTKMIIGDSIHTSFFIAENTEVVAEGLGNAMTFHGSILTTTADTLKIEWAQNTNSVANIIVEQGSYVKLTRLIT